VLVTREADYAIRCVLEVARQGRVSAARVAELQGISPTFLGKIVQSLARAGVVATRRGVGGGVSLAVAPEEISLLWIIEAVEGPLSLNECLTATPSCLQMDSCPAYPFLCHAQEALRSVLDVSVAEMLRMRPRSVAVPDAGTVPVLTTPSGNGAVRRAAPGCRGRNRATTWRPG
jgi:Rrf2 family protein